ncbi:MAG TPA: MFS transporter [Nevskiaceae bacterium]|nr:MFS transporter [Nevskiaceae bacterium]
MTTAHSNPPLTAPSVTPASGAPVAATLANRWTLPAVCIAAFLVFVQTFMVAPLIPRLAEAFDSSFGWVGLAIPAYVVPEALATLAVGPLSDRAGRRQVIYAALVLFIVLTALTATAHHIDGFIGWRVATGIAAAGVVPVSLSLIGDVVPFARRGRAVGWLFGSIAGGTAAGAAIGALLEPLVGWRALFVAVAALSALLCAAAWLVSALPRLPRRAAAAWSAVARGYLHLLTTARARRTYGYVLLNAILQSGVFTWLGVYLHQRYGLNETGIGLALLGYGIPGLLFGPLIGRLADRYGRSIIVPTGVVLTSVCAFTLATHLPLDGARVAIVLLSLGFDLTHPQLAAIVTDLGSGRGQAVALMAFCLFGGFGLGSLLFQAALPLGFTGALSTFGGVAAIAALAAFALFRAERPRVPAARPSPAR